MLGGCLKLGRFLINDNFGLFLFSLIQIILQSSVLAYTIKFLKKHKISFKTRLIILLIYCLVPMFPFYAMSGVKDTIYTNLIIIYLMLIYTIIREYKDKKMSINLILGLLVNVILIALFRNNGIYVLVLSLPVVIIYCRKNLIPLLIVLIILIGGYQTYNKVILPYFKIKEDTHID